MAIVLLPALATAATGLAGYLYFWGGTQPAVPPPAPPAPHTQYMEELLADIHARKPLRKVPAPRQESKIREHMLASVHHGLKKLRKAPNPPAKVEANNLSGLMRLRRTFVDPE